MSKLIFHNSDDDGEKIGDDGYISIAADNYDATSCDGGEYTLTVLPEPDAQPEPASQPE